MSVLVKLNSFEGPLDLLLYLIRQNDMDIREIEIAKVTDQYLELLNAMRELDVDLASEFIVMAATLIYIKSKMMLPLPELEADEEGQDPREALIQRLIEYQKYKFAADALSKKPYLNEDLFKAQVRYQEIQPDFDPKEGLIEVGVYELALGFQGVIARSKKVVHHIDADEMSIEEKMLELVGKLNQRLNDSLEFKSLISDKASRMEIIITFIAILELTRLSCLKLYQSSVTSDIHLSVIEGMGSFDLKQIHVMPPQPTGES